MYFANGQGFPDEIDQPRKAAKRERRIANRALAGQVCEPEDDLDVA